MSLVVTSTPDIQLSNADLIDVSSLNRLAKSTFAVSGTLSAAEISAGAVTDAKTKVGAHFFASTCVFSGGVYTLTWPAGQGAAALANGLLVVFKADAANTGATDLNIATGGAKNLLKNSGGTASDSELLANDVLAGMIVVARYDGTNFRVLNRLPSQDPASATAGAAQDLETYRHDSTATTIKYGWTNVVLRSLNGLYFVAGAASGGTLDASSSGSLNKLDVGALAAGWYKLWVVSDGATSGMVLGQAAASTPDSGILSTYPYFALIGKVYATSGTNIREYIQRGNRFWISNKEIVNTGGAPTIWTTLAGADLTAFQVAVPDGARTCIGTIGTATDAACRAAVSATLSDGSVSSTTPSAVQAIIQGSSAAALNAFYAAGAFEVPVRGTGALRNIQWKVQSAAPTYKIDITGYSL